MLWLSDRTMWQECSWKYIIGRFGLGKYSRSRMSVWEMDCSGKGSVVFRLRNNFLHFWGSCFLLLLLRFQVRIGVGKAWVYLPYSLSGCLRHLKLRVGLFLDLFQPVQKWTHKIAITMPYSSLFTFLN